MRFPDHSVDWILHFHSAADTKREIYGLIDELTGDGLAVIVVSSELPEILAIADHILVLCEGRQTAEFNRAEATSERVMQAALPRRKEAAWN